MLVRNAQLIVTIAFAVLLALANYFITSADAQNHRGEAIIVGILAECVVFSSWYLIISTLSGKG